MEEIELVTKDGVIKVNLITYLTSDDASKHYVVYSKGEKYGDSNDKIVYISIIEYKDNGLFISEITDDEEWKNVQKLLRRIANVS